MLLLLFAMTVRPVVSLADDRVALVIGNSEYGAEIGRLKNPANDARLIAQTLTELGFDVALELDADQKAMKRAIKSFGAKLRGAGSDGIGLFYYAGHGVQVGGENFLVPIGAQIEAEGDVSIEAISARDVLSQMQYAGNAVNLVFLDACRNNPLTRGFRSGERGLARVDAPRGSFVGYSTAPGEVAEDGEGANSPYAAALAEELRKPGESVDTAHRNVRARVLSATGQRQTPWDSSSLSGAVVLAGLTPEASVSPTQPAPNGGTDKEALFWETIKNSTDPAEFEAYLKQYPNGTFVDIARARIAKLNGSSTAAPQLASVAPETERAPLEVEGFDATYVAKQSANVRDLPSSEARIVGKYSADDAVSVTGRVKGKDWLQVAFKGADGYVSAKLLAEADAKEIEAWRGLKKEMNEENIRAFLKSYPNGYFKPKAQAHLQALSAASSDSSTQTTAASTVTQSAAASQQVVADPPAKPSPPTDQIGRPDHPGWTVDAMNGCWIWNPIPETGESVTWTGSCDSTGPASGNGTLTWRSSQGANVYSGPLVNGRPHGAGNWAYGDGGSFVGTFANGRAEGQGKRVYANHNVYEGNWSNGDMNGQGKFVWSDGAYYEGEFKDGLFHGKGKQVSPDGTYYKGSWANDLPEGWGEMTFKSGSPAVGMWRKGCLFKNGQLDAWYSSKAKSACQ